MTDRTKDRTEVLASIGASTPRRWFATAVLWALALLLIWLALAQPPAPGWQVFLIVTGALAAWVAELLRRATLLRVELTAEGLRDSSGREIAAFSNIRSVERGVFAFKPSNGFLVVLKQRRPRVWAPGLWWRFGRRVGVGGVTASHQAKLMAEQIALRLAEAERGGADPSRD